jgi:TonB family protein
MRAKLSPPKFTPAKNEGAAMKKCVACGETFEDNFSFCPIDGSSFALSLKTQRPLQLTLIEETLLTRRLATEITFLAEQVSEGWPHFKRSPVAFSKSKSIELAKVLALTLSRPYARSGLAAAFIGLALLILSVALLEKRLPKTAEPKGVDDLYAVAIIDTSSPQANKAGAGIGAGEKGRIGFNRGKGEGSNPRPARAQGGGSGGNGEQLPASQGRLPVASPITAPITRTYARLPSLPEAGIDIDPALWRNLNFASYGDPRSKSTTPSNGPGDGGGVGTNKGTGIGEGEGPGFGPGRNGNMGNDDNRRGNDGIGGGPGCGTPGCVGSSKIYPAREVTQRARVVFKPEPQYTEAARRNGTTGTVILRVVFSSSGEVTNIQAVQKLGDGLTEKAIAAARLIRFVPATRQGQPVSMYMQLEYNFNLY